MTGPTIYFEYMEDKILWKINEINGAVIDIFPKLRIFFTVNESSISTWNILDGSLINEDKIEKVNEHFDTNCISSDGRYYVTANELEGIHVWNIKEKKLLWHYPEKDSHLLRHDYCVISKNNHKLITGGQSDFIIVWDLITGRTIKKIESGGWGLIKGTDTKIYLFSRGPAELDYEKYILKQYPYRDNDMWHLSQWSSLAVPTDDSLLVGATEGFEVFVLDLKTGDFRNFGYDFTTGREGGYIGVLISISYDNLLVALYDEDKKGIIIWNIQSEKLVGVIDVSSIVTNLRFVNDQYHLLVESKEDIILWNLSDLASTVKVFISYSTKDKKDFNIPRLVHKLEENPLIQVYYYERDCQVGQSIVDYMEEFLTKCDVFLTICSPNSLISSPVRKEINMAFISKKKIIHLFKDIKNIRMILRDTRGLKFENENIDSVITEIVSLIIGKNHLENPEVKFENEEEKTVEPELKFINTNYLGFEFLEIIDALYHSSEEDIEELLNELHKETFVQFFKIEFEKTKIYLLNRMYYIEGNDLQLFKLQNNNKYKRLISRRSIKGYIDEILQEFRSEIALYVL